jgi:hypothetical protein
VLVILAVWGFGLPVAAGAWRRRRQGHTPADRVTGAWSDATLALALVGAPRRPAETPLEHAARAWKLTGIDRTSLTDLAGAATRAVYAVSTVDDAVASNAERLRHEIAARARDRATWKTRMRARLDPRVAGTLR